MPWSGGSYTKGNNATGGWTGDASLGIGIEAGRHDTQDNDFATGINNCLTKDGSNSATANINFGGFIPSNVGAGTAAAPAYCAGGDVNTGMFSPAADTIAWATNGTERMRITNAGNVGIGVTPTEKLDVNGPVYIRPSTAPTFDSGTRLWSESGFGANYDAFNHKFNVGAVTRAEAMRITNGGSVGIGITNPTHPLEVVGNTSSPSGPALKLRGRPTNESSKITFTNNADTTEYAVIAGTSAELYIYHGTKVNLDAPIYLPGLNSGAGTHFVKWNSTSKILTYDTSSIRYKENVADIPYGLNCIKLLSPKVFTYKTTGNRDVGFIAEEMREVVPEIVSLDAEGKPDAISYDRLTAVLCKAIQELTTKVEALEALQTA